jgi:transketolase
MTLDGSTSGVFEDDILKLYESMNWDTHLVTNSEDIKSLNKAINDSKKVLDKPV